MNWNPFDPMGFSKKPKPKDKYLIDTDIGQPDIVLPKIGQNDPVLQEPIPLQPSLLEQPNIYMPQIGENQNQNVIPIDMNQNQTGVPSEQQKQKPSVDNEYYKDAMEYMMGIMHGESPYALLKAQKEKQSLAAEQASSRQKMQQQLAQQGVSAEQGQIFSSMLNREQEAKRVELGSELAANELAMAQDAASKLAGFGLQQEQVEIQKEQLEMQKQAIEDAQKNSEWNDVLSNYNPANPEDLAHMKTMWERIYPDRPMPSFTEMINKAWEGKSEKAGASLAAYVSEMKNSLWNPDTNSYDWNNDPILMKKLSDYWEATTMGEKFDPNNPIHKTWADNAIKQMSQTMTQKQFQETKVSIMQSDWYNGLDQNKKKEVDGALVLLEQLNLLGGFEVKKLSDGSVAFFSNGVQIYPSGSGTDNTGTITIGGVDYSYIVGSDNSVVLTGQDGTKKTYTYNKNDSNWYDGTTKITDADTVQFLNQHKPSGSSGGVLTPDTDVDSALKGILGDQFSPDILSQFNTNDLDMLNAIKTGNFQDIINSNAAYDLYDIYKKLPKTYTDNKPFSSMVKNSGYADAIKSIEDATYRPSIQNDVLLKRWDEYRTGSVKNGWYLTDDMKQFIKDTKGKYFEYKGKLFKMIGKGTTTIGKRPCDTIKVYDPVTGITHEIVSPSANKEGRGFTWDDVFAMQESVLAGNPSKNIVNDFLKDH